MKLCSNVCNRCRLVCVKFYLNRIRFAVVVAKCYGAHFFGTHGIAYIVRLVVDMFRESIARKNVHY